MSNELSILKENLPTLAAVMALNTASGVDVQTLAAQEVSYLEELCISKPEIKECIPETILYAVRSVLKKNLTLDPSAGLVYVKTRNVQVGGKWAKKLEVQESCEGLISVARQCGRILDIKRPRVEFNASGIVTKVTAELLVPSLPSPRWEEIEFTESDFLRWRLKSHQENGRNKADAAEVDYSNALYRSHNGGIDPEFARAKAIRHALKKRGTNVNESRATTIYIPTEKIVKPEIDEQVINEDYHQFEDIPTTTETEPIINADLM